MIKKISKFTGDHAGLEKVLRFLQAVCMIVASSAATTADAQPWITARTQFAIGRRYFRYLKFIDCFSIASEAFEKFTAGGGVIALLEFGKWSCLGMYLVFEATTIMDALGVWKTAWAPRNMLEANKFWFYSILCSIFAGIFRFWQMYRTNSHVSVKEVKEAKEKDTSEKSGSEKASETIPKKQYPQLRDYEPIIRRLAIDFCDLTIPGFATGWAKTTPVIVGIGSATSAVLASIDIWNRVQK